MTAPRHAVSVALAVLALGCAAPPPTALRLVRDSGEWRTAREDVDAIWSRRPRRPYALEVEGQLTGRGIASPRQRGVVAVCPGRGARLALLGVGGVVAWDLWISEDEVLSFEPLSGRRRRARLTDGDALAAAGRLLSLWLVTASPPRALAATAGSRERRIWLQGRSGIVELRRTGRELVLVAATAGGAHLLRIDGADLAPVAGRAARFEAPGGALSLELRTRVVVERPPDERLCDDPDRGGVAL